jgi:hypothetical protein
MDRHFDTTVAPPRHASRSLQAQFSALPSAGEPVTRATILDRQADAELVMGRLGIAERLARMAAELRGAAP